MEGRTMGQVLHGSATTTEASRRTIQHGQESLRALAKRRGINPKTVANVEETQLRRRPADRSLVATMIRIAKPIAVRSVLQRRHEP